MTSVYDHLSPERLPVIEDQVLTDAELKHSFKKKKKQTEKKKIFLIPLVMLYFVRCPSRGFRL